ncbi:hypothetical protein EJ06DRAFT_531243 [Trichodelitschia bisporula]|uniref:PH domain-containing protein n=1 Tax=Trichodelitschia bisporula TaxID=703511 RepID=A0A6G1HUI3_9PEZI|nr:hypothetical protein EJ06DRAFT_531243 [Trichodelitschia bisporula]
MTWQSLFAQAALADSLAPHPDNADSEPRPPRQLPVLPPTRSQQYGYHNTFHTHASAVPPPLSPLASSEPDVLPPYTCTVHREGALELRREFLTPFQPDPDGAWQPTYAVLRGTQLNLFSTSAKPKPKPAPLLRSRSFRRSVTDVPESDDAPLLKSYSLQHAEVGAAPDAKYSDAFPARIRPAPLLARLVRPTGRARRLSLLISSWPADHAENEVDPAREWSFRLRVESEQILLSATSQEEMLAWIETLCAAIDISPPLEDRSEPRYRSLPRRARRQRQIEEAAVGYALGALYEGDDERADARRRLVEQQERIVRRFYPQLLEGPEPDADAEAHAEAAEAEAEATTEEPHDPEADELDPSDPDEARQHKAAPPQPSPAAVLRYRRRCAPILLRDSPRASPVVFCAARRLRLRIDARARALVPFEMAPPRYDNEWRPAAARGDALVRVESVSSESGDSDIISGAGVRPPRVKAVGKERRRGVNVGFGDAMVLQGVVIV